jgi:hypothetical protein
MRTTTHYYPPTFQTMYGTKVHAIQGRETLCALIPQAGDTFLSPDKKVTCKKCLRAGAA